MTETTGAAGQIKPGFQSETGRAMINELKTILGGDKGVNTNTDLNAKSEEIVKANTSIAGGNSALGQRGVVV